MPEARNAFQFTAHRADAHSRLDRVLVRRVTGVSRFSRTVARRWIEAGAVAVDGRPARRPALRIAAGSCVEVSLPDSAPLRQRPCGEPGRLEILYEDGALMVVNKPAGLVVHPTYTHASGTLLNHVLWHLRDRADARPGIVTRLDKDTSGLVLIALSPTVHARLTDGAAATRIHKSYLASVAAWPRPAQGRIRERLMRDPDDRRRVVVRGAGLPRPERSRRQPDPGVRRGGPSGPPGVRPQPDQVKSQESETRYEVLSRRRSPAGRESLVRCDLVTGRTHQIRVHLASRGWPIIGDRTYGRADSRIGRQALHAWRLAFPHPVTGARVEIEAPLPDDMLALGLADSIAT